MAGVRLQSGEFAVTHHACHKEGPEIDGHGKVKGDLAQAQHRQVGERRKADHQQRKEQLALIPAVALETQDEREQIQRQRQHPEHRNRCNVGGQETGIGHHQNRRARGQSRPQNHVRPARCGPFLMMLHGDGFPLAPAPGEQRAGNHEAGKQSGPKPGLPARREHWLDGDRIRQ